MRLHEIAHKIDMIVMMDLDIRQEDRAFLIDYLCAGYNEEGVRIERSPGLELAMRCIDCDNKSEGCEETCPLAKACMDSE